MKSISYFLILWTILLSLINYQAISQSVSNKLDLDKRINEFIIESWNKKDGLPSNSLLDIHQGSNGYIWMSSYEGLIRFDGVDFTVFNKNNTKVFKNNGIGVLTEDSAGTLWMTTQNSGLVSYKNNKFTAHHLNGKISSLHRVIHIDHQNRIWSCTSKGKLFSYTPDTTVFYNDSILDNNAIYSEIAQTKKGDLWIATEGKGLYRYNGEKFSRFTTRDGLVSNWISSLTFDKEGKLWIGTEKGISVFNTKTRTFSTYKNFHDYTINRIITEQDGALWIATNNGLFRENQYNNSTEHLTENKGLAHNHIIDLMIGFENSLWIIHYKGGLSRIKNSIFVTYTTEDKMLGSIVNTVCETDSATYLVGFNNGYINKIEHQKISEFKTRKNLYGERIRDIFLDSRNNLWIGTYSGLLKIMPDGSEKWYAPENGFPGKYIRVIYEDHQNNIWVGTRNEGLIKIDPGHRGRNFTVINKARGLSNNLIMSIDEDTAGNLVAGISKGGVDIISGEKVIAHYDQNNGLVSNIVFNTYTDENGCIWIAAKDGLNWLKNGKIHHIKINKYILPHTPYDVLEDHKNNLWMPCSHGVMKVNKHKIFAYENDTTGKVQYTLYNRYDGMKQSECTSTAEALKAQNNTLWFPTIEGVATIQPSKIFKNNYIPPVYIEKITVDDKTYKKAFYQEIEPGPDRIVFHYTALSFYEPKRVFFKYKLQGYHEKWSQKTNARKISFTNLPPGDYTFRVKACNNDGAWNNAGARMYITIRPFWYQTTIFYIICGVLALLLIYLAYKLRVRQIQRRQIVLKRLVKQRTEEITEKNRKIRARNDEILQASEELKTQNEEIQTINDELQRYKNHLERIVEERTKELVIAKEKAEESDKLKTAFLTNMSHEIRTPMNAIVGFADLLSMTEAEKEEFQEYIQKINENSEALLHLIDDIVEVSRIESGEITVNKKWYYINQLIEELHKDYTLKIEGRNNLEIKTNKASTEKDFKIYTDKYKLEHALKHLLNNALKFTEIGLIELGYFMPDAKTIQIYVKDSGIGISPDNLDVIFERFRKIEDKSVKLYRGAGLGLYIAKNLVTKIDGQLDVDSQIGVGSVFTITLTQPDDKNDPANTN